MTAATHEIADMTGRDHTKLESQLSTIAIEAKATQRVPHRKPLVIITCGGPFDRNTRIYADNIVDVADRI